METGMVQLKEELMLWEEEMLARNLTSLRVNSSQQTLCTSLLILGADRKLLQDVVVPTDADVFLAHITTKEAKDKLEGKRLEDVPIVRDFPEVFPEDLSGIPSAPTSRVPN
ncbi:hypothetical protein Tco_1384188 [Tanacetum coccineum]